MGCDIRRGIKAKPPRQRMAVPRPGAFSSAARRSREDALGTIKVRGPIVRAPVPGHAQARLERRSRSEINRQPLLLPIPVAHGFRPVATAKLFRQGRVLRLFPPLFGFGKGALRFGRQIVVFGHGAFLVNGIVSVIESAGFLARQGDGESGQCGAPGSGGRHDASDRRGPPLGRGLAAPDGSPIAPGPCPRGAAGLGRASLGGAGGSPARAPSALEAGRTR